MAWQRRFQVQTRVKLGRGYCSVLSFKASVENKEIKTANVVEGKGRSKLKVMDKENADAKVPVFAKEINPIKEKLLALLGALRKTAWSKAPSIKGSNL